MKTLSLVTQETAPNRVKTFYTLVGLDYGKNTNIYQGSSASYTVPQTDRFGWKIGPLAAYAKEPEGRFGRIYPVAGSTYQRDQYRVQPYLQSFTFPGFGMSHLPDPAGLDGIRAEVVAVFVNPVVSGASTTLYDLLRNQETLASTLSQGDQPVQNILAVGSFLGLMSRVYLPETFTREAWAGMPFAPFESPDFAKPVNGGPTWNWKWPEGTDYWFLGRISSIEAVGQTITVRATNQENGFDWPRIPEDGSYEPTRGERIPLIYGDAERFSVPILAAPFSSTLVQPLDDVQTEGIVLSPPLAGLPPTGFLWIGGEKLTYSGYDAGTGALTGVARGPSGGTGEGSAAFHNGGERIYAPGTTLICLGDEGTSAVETLYVRTNQSNNPVQIPSSFYSLGTLDSEDVDGVGVPIRAAQIDARKFQQLIQYYQRANVSRQVQYATDAAVDVTWTDFGPGETVTGVWYPVLASGQRMYWDPRTASSAGLHWVTHDESEPPFPILQPTLPLDGSAALKAELSRLLADWDRSHDNLFAYGVDLWNVQGTLDGTEANLWQGSKITAPTDWSAEDRDLPFPRVSVAGLISGWVRGWEFAIEPDLTNVSSISTDWLYSVDFSYTLTVSQLKAGTSQEFELGISSGADYFYEVSLGAPMLTLKAVEAGNITFNWTLVAKEGTRVSDLENVAFCLFPSTAFGSGSPDFTMEMHDGATRNEISGTIEHSPSVSETLVTDEAAQSGLLKDYGVETIWGGEPRNGPGIGMLHNWSSAGANTFQYDTSTGQLTQRSSPSPNVSRSTFQSWGELYFRESDSVTPGTKEPYLVTFTTRPDFAQMRADDKIDDSTVCYSARLKLTLTVPFSASDKFRILWRVTPKLANFPTDSLLPGFESAQGNIFHGSPFDEVDMFLKNFEVYEATAFASTPFAQEPMKDLDKYDWRVEIELGNDYTSRHTGRGFGFMGRIPGLEGTNWGNLHNSWTWRLNEAITAKVEWEFNTSSVVPPAQRDSSPQLTTAAIIANPGAFELEFFADARGPLASKGETDSPGPQYPETPRPERFKDLQAFDTDYGETTAVVNPTDILKRWIERSDSATNPGTDLELFEADYSDLDASKNLNDNYNTLFRGVSAPYIMGFDARNLGSDWESVLARIAWEARTNVVRVSESEYSSNNTDVGMPFRLLSAGTAPDYSFGSSVAQLSADDVLAFDFVGKRATEVANSTVAFYDTDDSRLGDTNNPNRYRLTVDRPLGGRPIQTVDLTTAPSEARSDIPDALSSTNLSDEITLALTDHGASLGEVLQIGGATDLGSGATTITASILNEEFHVVTEVIDDDSLKFRVSIAANETVSSGGGALMSVIFYRDPLAGSVGLETLLTPPTVFSPYGALKQNAATTAFWLDFSGSVQGSATNAIRFQIGRRKLFAGPVHQNSTFVGELSFRGSQYYETWGTDGVTGSPTINITDLGLGDPTQPGDPTENSLVLVDMVFDLDAPPDPDPSGTWAAFKTAWDADDILGVRIQLDSSLGSNLSGYELGKISTLSLYDSEAVASANRVGVHPAAFQLETHRTTPGESYSLGAEDWLDYMGGELAKDSRLVDVVVRTDAGWSLELGDVVTCDVPAQVLDEGVTPVEGTVQLRLIGVSRTEEGIALRGVVL